MYRKKKRCLLFTITLVTVVIVVLNLLTTTGNNDDEPAVNVNVRGYAVESTASIAHSSSFTSHNSSNVVKDAKSVGDKTHIDYDQQSKGRGLLQIKKGAGLKNTDKNISELQQVLQTVETCLAATNLDSDPLLKSKAKKNGAYFLKEFRNIIPESFLDNYTSHCWKDNFEVSLNTKQPQRVKGHIGRISFDKSYNDMQKESLYDLQKRYHGHFSSSLVCLPKVYILGFPKCGSTFLWCFLERLLRMAQKWPAHSEKEPHFWMRASFPTAPIREPFATDISDYIANFVGGIDQIELGNKGLVLMDGNPNLIFTSPRFNEGDRLENNCLLPVLLPRFMPEAKYMVVMRNPIKMLYSAFWFSCTCCHAHLSKATQLKGPNLFHDRITTKIDRFTDCMRDKEIPAMSNACSTSAPNYGSCIKERLHLLDRCVDDITYDLFSPELPNCGRTRVERGIYYVHVRKWLSVVPREKFYFVALEEIADNPQRIAKEMLQIVDAPSASMTNLPSQARSSFTVCSKENSQQRIDYKHRKELHMRKDTEELLVIFFRPFNELLADLLGDPKYKLLWK